MNEFRRKIWEHNSSMPRDELIRLHYGALVSPNAACLPLQPNVLKHSPLLLQADAAPDQELATRLALVAQDFWTARHELGRQQAGIRAELQRVSTPLCTQHDAGLC